jgi:hypothetical protein
MGFTKGNPPRHNRGNLPSRDTNPELCDAEGRFIDPRNRRVRDPNRPRAKPDYNRDTARQGVDEFTDTEHELIFALEKIELRQQQLNQANHELQVLLNDEPKLATIWKKFESNGRVNVEQLRQFLRGQMRPRIVTKRGGLRLISDRPEANKIVYDDDDGGPNAT